MTARVHAALPVNRDFQTRRIFERLDEDLTDGGAQETFLEPRVRLRMVPHAREVAAEITQQFDHALLLLGLAPAHLALMFPGRVQLGELLVQARFEGIGDEAVLGIARIELLEDAIRAVLKSFDLEVLALDLACVLCVGRECSLASCVERVR